MSEIPGLEFRVERNGVFLDFMSADGACSIDMTAFAKHGSPRQRSVLKAWCDERARAAKRGKP